MESLLTTAALVPETTSFDRLIRALEQVHHPTPGNKFRVYNIQRLYLDALEALSIREDTIPGPSGRGELVMFQLGKFSQVISDYETIYFRAEPARKYQGFVSWLRTQAPSYYDQSDTEVGYSVVDAVTISTIHAAKGMQWPVVFVPCLRRNRFPAKRIGGISLSHVIPDAALANPDRYRGTRTDELRLLYVAVTRAKKYLYTSWSPVPGNRLYGNASEFVHLISSVSYVSTADPGAPGQKSKRARQPRIETPQIELSFTELKYYFDCPYQFKLRFLYGFNPPIHEALGYGNSLHHALAEIHKKAMEGEVVGLDQIDDLLDRHLHLPYAYPQLNAILRSEAEKSLRRYFRLHGDEIADTIHSEKQVQVRVGSGIVVDGRIDLIKRIRTGETSIVDFKSSERAQAEEITRDQLNVYAVGYADLTGQSADLIEVLNLDENGKNERDVIDPSSLAKTRLRIRDAGEAIREGRLSKLDSWCDRCSVCDLSALCRAKS